MSDILYGCPANGVLNLPFRHLPKGTKRIRIRARNDQFVTAFVKTRLGIREFMVGVAPGGKSLRLVFEQGANKTIQP